MFVIYPQDVISIAFIKALDKDESQRFLPYKKIGDLGYKVAAVVKKRIGVDTLFLFWRNSIDEFLYYHEDDFKEETREDGTLGIRIREGIDTDSLVKKFCGALPLDILIAFIETEL